MPDQRRMATNHVMALSCSWLPGIPETLQADPVWADERQAERSAPSSYHNRQRPYQRPERRPSGPSAPGR